MVHQHVREDVNHVLIHPDMGGEEEVVREVRAPAVGPKEVEEDGGGVAAHHELEDPHEEGRPRRLQQPRRVVVRVLAAHRQRRAPLLVLEIVEALRLGDVLDHVLDDGGRALRRGQVERGRAVLVGLVGGEAHVVEQRERLLVVLVRRPVQRRVAAVVEQRDVGARLAEEEDEDGVVVLRRDHERRRVLPVERVDVRARLQQPAHHLRVPARRRPVDRLHPRAGDGGVRRRARLEEPVEQLRVARERAPVHRRRAARVGAVQRLRVGRDDAAAQLEVLLVDRGDEQLGGRRRHRLPDERRVVVGGRGLGGLRRGHDAVANRAARSIAPRRGSRYGEAASVRTRTRHTDPWRPPWLSSRWRCAYRVLR